MAPSAREPTLLDYLTQPNPVIVNDYSLGGLPTKFEITSNLLQRPWADFDYETLLKCYGDTLRICKQWGGISPSLKLPETIIRDEDTVEHLLTRAVVPQVNEGLEEAWSHLFKGQKPDQPHMTRGGQTRKSLNKSIQGHKGKGKPTGDGGGSGECSIDKTGYPDWAGIRANQDPNIWSNILPGESKLSRKWRMDFTQEGAEPYLWPLAQIEFYCTRQRNVRYGYLVTDFELVALRFQKHKIGDGIAKQRPTRAISTPGHQRNQSSMSDISMMSSSPSRHALDLSFHSASSTSEHVVIDMVSIPWMNSGPGKLTVKLALWWLHMMAAGGDTLIQEAYPPLSAWERQDNDYRQLSTGITARKPPANAVVLSPSPSRGNSPRGSLPPRNASARNTPSPPGSSPPRLPPQSLPYRTSPSGAPRTPPRGQRTDQSSSPLSSPPSSMNISPVPVSPPRARTPTTDEMQDIRFNGTTNQFTYRLASTGHTTHAMAPGTLVFDSRQGRHVYLDLQGGQLVWRNADRRRGQ
ncbi:hypothetical protein FQN51_002124 [Onygenales sp. PD_10]|nr:hypothetical protein FQN51_002124 [Onygenales sp. PD_10]